MTKNLAIIDDESEMEDIYRLVLEKQIEQGLIELDFFSDSRDFVKWLTTHSPDLVMTDINMPYIDGPNIIQILNNSGRTIPTYFVSGYQETEFKKAMEDLGVFRFLSKPLDLDHILGLIQLDLGIPQVNQ